MLRRILEPFDHRYPPSDVHQLAALLEAGAVKEPERLSAWVPADLEEVVASVLRQLELLATGWELGVVVATAHGRTSSRAIQSPSWDRRTGERGRMARSTMGARSAKMPARTKRQPVRRIRSADRRVKTSA